MLSKITKVAKNQRRRIGIAIIKKDEEVIESLKKAKKYVEVVIYGVKIAGFESVKTNNNTLAKVMINDFGKGKIDQFVRGQADDFSMVSEFKKQFNLSPSEKRTYLAFFEMLNGWQCILMGTSNPEAGDLKDKIRILDMAIKWLNNNFDEKLAVAVMATCRPESYGKDKITSKTFDEAEKIVMYLKSKGIKVKNVNIEIESAEKWGANILLPARGNIGNQIFRSLLFLGGAKNYFCPTIFNNGLCYEDNSRKEKDFFYHLLFAQFLANKNV